MRLYRTVEPQGRGPFSSQTIRSGPIVQTSGDEEFQIEVTYFIIDSYWSMITVSYTGILVQPGPDYIHSI